ncbi:MAG: T9SS type A sorting domain-containing protein [Melioribacteraceae bacterium]|nr:T9SS type A sorting domain-containing protein [Melioribacteraceae bacterium]
MIRTTVIFLLGFLISNSFAQIPYTANLRTHVDSIITNMIDTEGTNEYQSPTVQQLADWDSTISKLLSADYSDAAIYANQIDYRLLAFTDNGDNQSKLYYVLEQTQASTNYWGTFIYNPSPGRTKLFIQSPHPKNEFNTGKQGFFVFKEIGARAFFLTGIYRCNNSAFTDCDGTTSVCTGSSEKYRISDQPHVVNGTLHKTTERMENRISDMITIQLHGFSKDGNDPDLIMSNGIQSDTPPVDYLDLLRTNLLTQDATLTFVIVHEDQNWTELRGLVNTQGRLINGAPDPCDDNATVNTGRFLHLEQAKVKLRETEADWTKMANALASTFAEDGLPVELVSFDGEIVENKIKLVWQTATETKNYGFDVEKSNSRDIWEKIAFINGHGNSSSPKEYVYIDENPSVGKNKYRLKQIDTDGAFKYLETLEIEIENIVPSELSLFQNYPNPFNPVTIIEYELPTEGIVTLKIYDLLGKEISTLVNGHKNPGRYSVEFNAENLPSGIYFYRLTSNGEHRLIRKMQLLK